VPDGRTNETEDMSVEEPEEAIREFSGDDDPDLLEADGDRTDWTSWESASAWS